MSQEPHQSPNSDCQSLPALGSQGCHKKTPCRERLFGELPFPAAQRGRRALPTETLVESGTSQSKSRTYFKSSNSVGDLRLDDAAGLPILHEKRLCSHRFDRSAHQLKEETCQRTISCFVACACAPLVYSLIRVSDNVLIMRPCERVVVAFTRPNWLLGGDLINTLCDYVRHARLRIPGRG